MMMSYETILVISEWECFIKTTFEKQGKAEKIFFILMFFITLFG